MTEDRRERERDAGSSANGSAVGSAASANLGGDTPPPDSTARPVAASVGAVGGAVAGAAAGTVTLGPIGAIIGAIAGVIGGGWTGLAAAAPTHYTSEHEREYREHFESDTERVADLPYEKARPAYQLGHFAARNPDYSRRAFESIEEDLRRGWTDEVRAEYGDWRAARRYAREAFVRERARSQGRIPVQLNMGGSETHQRPSFADPIPPGDPDRVAGGRRVPGRDDEPSR